MVFCNCCSVPLMIKLYTNFEPGILKQNILNPSNLFCLLHIASFESSCFSFTGVGRSFPVYFLWGFLFLFLMFSCVCFLLLYPSYRYWRYWSARWGKGGGEHTGITVQALSGIYFLKCSTFCDWKGGKNLKQNDC